jgi:hypothetical protein
MAKPVAQTPNPTENSRHPFANLPRLMNCSTAVVCDKDEGARVTLFAMRSIVFVRWLIVPVTAPVKQQRHQPTTN